MKNKILILLFLSVALLSSCENGDWDFPDYEYQAVYFAYQYPVRTITLGEDIFDTTLDNEGKCVIIATIGGLYENKQNVTIDFQVDNSMVDGLVFEGAGNKVLPLPSSHYTLGSDDIVIPKGELTGGVEVQLTDAFFNDPKSLENNYVIPVRMLNATVVDSILSGEPQVATPRRGVETDWATLPKDFIFYAVKYINTWEGFYLRRGEDVITGKNGNTGLNRTEVRREESVVDDEVVLLDSQSRWQVNFPLSLQDIDGNDLNIVLLLNFDEEGNVNVSSSNPSEYTATGSGSFVKDGEKNSWGSQDRDALYISYEIETEDLNIRTEDTLVMRNRGVAMETFKPVLE
ncbi:DUF5627 domain-containing protein [Zunongwangia pacifica]|uniref:DUF5627 domain-containing protein n=1 Tax=Zunongwangia pacifica TaxID=2911062 RepID=A0A9X2A3M9_9FLAO|nr:DUF5627 domain-containing protein [Zunongwangia pacifica]MCL6219709.1 DUF5627 domain-containing protein [Zunongwangia pacifica]